MYIYIYIYIYINSDPIYGIILPWLLVPSWGLRCCGTKSPGRIGRCGSRSGIWSAFWNSKPMYKCFYKHKCSPATVRDPVDLTRPPAQDREKLNS